MNGFCVCYNGYVEIIDVGWYKNNLMHGNWMSFDPKNNMKIRKSGWYRNGIRLGDV